ncbi:putative bifunctional diguanylate cyclase/phosphodiesterase [Chthonobacter rhizosphaerae]|uniref:putative bifunctional diguanylate cyclase/phosphodiesterase n=1 Tax=Chthonobacter rhizosphaerae TaxID=2735553 RepID=UPI0015EED7F5|nr:bifunctional diguanylate cyclase/phosphodiesterase [Chthonobacter rhizosphaerae]
MARRSATVRLAAGAAAVVYVAVTVTAAFVTWRDLSATEEQLPRYGFYQIRDLRFAFADVTNLEATLDLLETGVESPAALAVLSTLSDRFFVRFDALRFVGGTDRPPEFDRVLAEASEVLRHLDALVSAGAPFHPDRIGTVRESTDRLLASLAGYVHAVEQETDRSIALQHAEFGALKVRVVVSILLLSALVAGVLALLLAHRRDSARLRVAMNEDALTRLANRRAFSEWIAASEGRPPHALILLDVDDFKPVNDHHGHDVGDRLLTAVGDWLRQDLAQEGIAVRWGGDEFVAVVPVGKISRAEIMARFAAALARRPRLKVDEGEIAVSLSGGVSLWPEDGATFAEILLNADIALYEAKDLGKGRTVMFEPEIRVRRTRVDSMRDNLRRAIAEGHLRLLWQPQVDLLRRRMIGAEGLLRWHDPETGAMIPPAEFIPIAERSDLILEIDAFVLDAACATLARWDRAGADPIRLSVNVSARHFQRPTLVRTVADALERHGVAPAYLEIEITEGVFLADSPIVRANLAHLAGMGLRLALDDFGTGYSNVAYMMRMRPSLVKIDRSFLREPDLAARDKIMGSLLGLAESIGAETLVEGVETAADLAFLTNAGFRRVQGFLFARPMPEEDLLAWRASYEAAGAIVQDAARRHGRTHAAGLMRAIPLASEAL